MLPSDWEKKLIDMNVHKLNDKDIQWADMVFVSGMIVQKESMQKLRCFSALKTGIITEILTSI